MTDGTKARVIQEYVPGKQVTLAHAICNPRPELCSLIGVENSGAIGIMTITPGEGAVIAADIASKSGDVTMDFIDRFTGCVLFTGDVAAVESSLEAAVRTLSSVLGFTPAPITRT
jgi:ethanolamine utilization protein EutS